MKIKISKEFALNSKKIPRINMRITRFERYKCIMKKHSCYVLLRFQFQDFFRYQIFPIPVPRLFSGTKFFRYRFRYFFTVPNFSDTGTETFFRYQFFPIPVPIPPKKWKIPDTGNSRYRYVELCSEVLKHVFQRWDGDICSICTLDRHPKVLKHCSYDPMSK